MSLPSPEIAPCLITCSRYPTQHSSGEPTAPSALQGFQLPGRFQTSRCQNSTKKKRKIFKFHISGPPFARKLPRVNFGQDGGMGASLDTKRNPFHSNRLCVHSECLLGRLGSQPRRANWAQQTKCRVKEALFIKNTSWVGGPLLDSLYEPRRVD